MRHRPNREGLEEHTGAGCADSIPCRAKERLISCESALARASLWAYECARTCARVPDGAVRGGAVRIKHLGTREGTSIRCWLCRHERRSVKVLRRLSNRATLQPHVLPRYHKECAARSRPSTTRHARAPATSNAIRHHPVASSAHRTTNDPQPSACYDQQRPQYKPQPHVLLR
jgi:hypothetical protein